MNCRHDVPTSMLVASSVVSLLLSAGMLNSMFGRTRKLNKEDVRALFGDYERSAIFIHYAIVVPLFEFFVIWGPRLNANIGPSSASSVTAFLIVNAISVFLLLLGVIFEAKYRLFVHKVQCWRIPICIVFLCDRDINFTVGFEALFIAASLLCSIFETVNVNELVAKTNRRRIRIRQTRKASGAKVSDGDSTEMSLTQPQPSSAAVARVALPPPLAGSYASPLSDDPAYESDTPPLVRHMYDARERQKQVAVNLTRLANTHDQQAAAGITSTLQQMVATYYRGAPSASTSVSQSKNAEASDSGF